MQDPKSTADFGLMQQDDSTRCPFFAWRLPGSFSPNYIIAMCVYCVKWKIDQPEDFY
jgi:hypothetical protein